MANVVPHSFKSELLSGTHNFANGGDSFKLALYTAGSGSPYAPTATVYDSSVSNEVSTGAPNAGYTTGGVALASQAVATGTGTATVDFANLTFSSATFSAAYGVIYNDDKSDKLCVVLDFGGTKTATNGDFTIVFPDPSTPANAIISLTS
jgi:hypothetical protein